MTTVTIKGALHLVDWGPHRYKAFHLLMGMDTTHKYHADMLWGMVLMPWVFLRWDQLWSDELWTHYYAYYVVIMHVMYGDY